MKILHMSMAILLCALPQVLGGDTVDISTPFKVASGSQKGSCDGQKNILNHMLQETTDMAHSAGDAIGAIIGRTSQDQSALRTAFMIFEIDGLLEWIRDGTKLSKVTRQNLGKTIGPYYDTLAGVATDSSFGHRLYCNDEFLVYTTHTYENGEETDKPISDAIPGATAAYWHIDAQAYVKDEGASSAGACAGTTKAFTLYETKTIALCPSAFQAPIIQNFDDILDDQSNKITAGQGLRNSYLSLPGILLHELAHAVGGGAVIDQPAVSGDGKAYTFQDCFDLADQKGTSVALLNAETWHLFALSTYLNGWDWATGAANTPKSIDDTS